MEETPTPTHVVVAGDEHRSVEVLVTFFALTASLTFHRTLELAIVLCFRSG